MKVLVVVDGHLARTPDGRVWSARIYNYDFFSRYLGAFDEVRVAMRIKEIESNEEYPNLCSGPNVEFYPIEEFKGPQEYVMKYFSIQKEMKKYFEGCDCGIFRIPSTVGYQFMHGYEKTGRPYAVEVVVDPWDFAAPGTLKTPFRPLIRWMWTQSLKRACMKANGVSYVTKYALQERYPSKARKIGESQNYFEEYYSSVNISKDFYGPVKDYTDTHSPMHIIHVTNYIGNHVKGHEELIEAVKILKNRGVNVHVDFVGEGNLIEEFTRFAEKCEVEDRITFIGKLATPSAVREALMRADLFVFPSHAEGLPRVLIEAMAVGLPAIATNVNGIPELLEKEYLVEVGDTEELANKIQLLVLNKNKYNEASRANLERACEYGEEKLQRRRENFYRKLSKVADNYIDSGEI